MELGPQFSTDARSDQSGILTLKWHLTVDEPSSKDINDNLNRAIIICIAYPK